MARSILPSSGCGPVGGNIDLARPIRIARIVSITLLGVRAMLCLRKIAGPRGRQQHQQGKECEEETLDEDPLRSRRVGCHGIVGKGGGIGRGVTLLNSGWIPKPVWETRRKQF